MEISVLFIGHSYARRAKEDRIEKGLDPNTIYIDNLKLNFKYIFKGGQNHKFFNENLKIRDEIKSHSPNIVITALAGNAVAKTSLYDMATAQLEMRKYYCWLNETFPQALIIPIEAEPRFNHHHELPPDHDPKNESYKTRRKAMNNAIQRMKGKHSTILLYKQLNDRDLFIRKEKNPYVHLNQRGYEIYWGLIISGLRAALSKYGFLHD